MECQCQCQLKSPINDGYSLIGNCMYPGEAKSVIIMVIVRKYFLKNKLAQYHPTRVIWVV
ncbi:unnamed protein product [Hymenolepis diminuta]|uniref:Uncharacterized protein n=1 Tax=Hymenolepis diminuta TaxID=6216 RepID=A0A564Z5V2_HYMDI|nr:unnamed protein product [Hymenolepis diminuta]